MEYSSSDRVTHLQNELDNLAQNFCNAIGLIQQESPKALNNPSEELQIKTLIQQLAQQVVQSTKNIQFLIDSLPGSRLSESQQLEILQQLEIENRQVGSELKEQIHKAGFKFLKRKLNQNVFFFQKRNY